MENISAVQQYKTTIEEAAKQLNARKALFLRRVLFMIWPAMVMGGLIALFLLLTQGIMQTDESIVGQSWFLYIMSMLYAGGALAVIYAVVVGSIFSIELNIWILSYLDGVKLGPQQSWRISKKLFWPALRLNSLIFLLYFTVPILIYALFVRFVSKTESAEVFIIGILGGFALLLVYAYLISIKLRYANIFFLNLYGSEDYSAQKVLKTMRSFNEIVKNKDLKQSLAVQFGVDTVGAAVGIVTGAVSSMLGQMGNAGRVAKGTMDPLALALTSQSQRYALSLGKNIVFRELWRSQYGEYPKVNQRIYQLSND